MKMCEVIVNQQSSEWFELRKSVCLTASHFGDAIGVGLGKPYDYLRHLLAPVELVDTEESVACRHGISFEPVIDGAYQRLTGRITKPGGFWILNDENDALCGFVGASPDAKVSNKNGGPCIGLAEYKAPMYCMYSESEQQLNGIPRKYMAQMQGQMAVTGFRWCDFMAVCKKTHEISLRRVHFSPSYWTNIGYRLLEFCLVMDTARRRAYSKTGPMLEFPEAVALKSVGMTTELFSGEESICVQNLLSVEARKNTDRSETMYKSCADIWMSYDEIISNSASYLRSEQIT